MIKINTGYWMLEYNEDTHTLHLFENGAAVCSHPIKGFLGSWFIFTVVKDKYTYRALIYREVDFPHNPLMEWFSYEPIKENLYTSQIKFYIG